VRFTLEALLQGFEDPISGLNAIREALHQLSPLKNQPIDRILWVPLEKVRPNDYNPNTVASQEMKLLYHSVNHDGYTQPIVTIWDEASGFYVIIDGFHRWSVAKHSPDVQKALLGLVPIVVLDRDINDRMAATVRHNRARGKHSVEGMSNMVFAMLEGGWSDAAICNELGMEPEELLRLKHITGFSRLFADVEYKKAWQTKRQIRIGIEARARRAANQPEPPAT
jgi:ParB-like chromosome segregation protein Spo0J